MPRFWGILDNPSISRRRKSIYQSKILDGCKLYLDFSDGNSSVVDYSIVANPITNNNTTVANINTAYSRAFDGLSGTYLNLTSFTNFNFIHQLGTTGKWTFFARVRPTSFAAAPVIFDTGGATTGNSGVYIAFRTTRAMWVEIENSGGGANSVISSQTAVIYPNDTTNFHDVLITYDQEPATGNLKIYIDGVLSHTGNKSGLNPSSNNCVHAFGGSYNGTNAMFPGNIQKLVFFDRLYPDFRG